MQVWVVCQSCGKSHGPGEDTGRAEDYVKLSCPACKNPLSLDGTVSYRISGTPEAKPTVIPIPGSDYGYKVTYKTKPEPEKAAKKSPPPEPEQLVRERRERKTNSDPAFNAALKSVMTDNRFDRRVAKRRKGKVDMKHLWRAEAGATNVFSQKQQRKNKDYHVVLLVDVSGSMEGTKMDTAVDTATFMAVALEKIGIGFTILAFNHWLVRIKERWEDLDQKLVKNRLHRIQDEHDGTVCNHDYEAVRHAYREFDGDAHGKVLMVFSDGSPSDCNHPGPHHKMDGEEKRYFPIPSKKDRSMDEIRQLVESRRDVSTIGIGIMHDAPRRIYPNCAVVNDLSQFKRQAMASLKKAIRRG